MKRKRTKKNSIFRKINLVYWLIILGIVGEGLFLGYQIIDYFEDTIQWKQASKTKIADEEPYMLYLTTKDRQLMKRYTKLVSDVYDRQKGSFTELATPSNMAELEKEYNALPQALKDKEVQTYTILTSLYPAEKEYKSFFNKSGAIKSSTNPTEIANFVEKYGPVIKERLDDDKDTSDKEFAKTAYQSMYFFKDDLSILAQVVDTFGTTFDIKPNYVSVKKDVPSSNLENWNAQLGSLHYKWLIIDDYISPIIQKSAKILSKHDNQINKINIYNKTKENKAVFDKFVQEYNDYKSKLIDIPTLNKRSDIERYKDNVTFNITEEYSDTVEKDNVISQSPRTGDFSKIFAGSVINVTISKGKKPVEKPKEEHKEEKPKEESKPKPSSSEAPTLPSSTSSSSSSTDNNSSTSTSGETEDNNGTRTEITE